MKFFLLVWLALFPLQAHAAEIFTAQFPTGCIYSCEGWIVTFPGTHTDKNGALDHMDDINEFVSAKTGKTAEGAQNIATFRIKKIGVK